MLPPPPPEVPRFGLGSDVLCPRKQAGRIAQICTLGDQRKEVCLIEERRPGRDPCPFSMAVPHKIQFTYLPTQIMPSFKGSSTDNSHILPHKPCLVSLNVFFQ